MRELSPRLENAVELLEGLSAEDLESVIGAVRDRETVRRNMERLMGGTALATECPFCHKEHFRKNGKVRGRQRYQCLECGRTFGDKEKPVWSGTKKGVSDWKTFIEATLEGDSLAAAAERVGISKTTAFFWRHKIYRALYTEGQGSAVLDAKVQADEKFVPLNFKGNELSARNLGMKPKKAKEKTTCAAYRGVGNAHKRGGSCHIRGLSSEDQVCVPAAIDQSGKSWGKATNMGVPSSTDLVDVYDGHLSGDAVLVTDKSTASRKYAEDHQIPILQLKGETEGRSGKDNLQMVNNLHSQVERELSRCHGVSTKYIDDYMQFVAFKRENQGKTVREMADVLFDRMMSVENGYRWKDVSAMKYQDFIFAGKEHRKVDGKDGSQAPHDSCDHNLTNGIPSEESGSDSEDIPF